MVACATLPYWADVKGAPQNSIIGGATLWVMKRKNADTYKGIAKFFTFLSSPEIQVDWHESTGYVPITRPPTSWRRSRATTRRTQATDIAIKELTNKPPTANSQRPAPRQLRADPRHHRRGARVGLGGQKTAKQALDAAVKRGNEQLVRFQEANK